MDVKPDPLMLTGTSLAVLWCVSSHMAINRRPCGLHLIFVVPTPAGPIRVGQALHPH